MFNSGVDKDLGYINKDVSSKLFQNVGMYQSTWRHTPEDLKNRKMERANASET
jgi:hypothetical protein